ncbi:MAG: chromosome partitioning protein ParB [Pseudomonadota bacterium]|nr:chromosome partitioning protein ParB [Pseudomonadota bacterium]
MTVGFREVDEKRREWRRLPAKRRKLDMDELLFPVVVGPKEKLYILDHHHLALALLGEGAKEVQAGTVCDLSDLSLDDFWVFLDHRSWVHCYDATGERRGFDKIPKTFAAMTDDPYRSLASSVQKLGGYAKPSEPFLEFLWANHFRRAISRRKVEDDFERALAEALELARQPSSAHLPGWAGPK